MATLKHMPIYVFTYNALSPEPMTVVVSREGTVSTYAFFLLFGFLYLCGMT